VGISDGEIAYANGEESRVAPRANFTSVSIVVSFAPCTRVVVLLERMFKATAWMKERSCGSHLCSG
jgi:hypothetical protein